MKFTPPANKMHPARLSAPFAHRERGVGLIEVLVAVLVLSLGLLGMAGMQAQALKSNQSSYARSQAVMFSYYILDAMRSDSATAKAEGYDTGTNPLCSAAAITGSTLPDNSRKDWINTMKAGLGNLDSTCGVIDCDNTGICTIKIIWNDELAGGLGAQTFETKSRL